ncbi:MAG TPA: hypothetical protein VLA79_20180 [Polyangia bacterium]|nr:hypothetical protein [Polyangia bacterium]
MIAGSARRLASAAVFASIAATGLGRAVAQEALTQVTVLRPIETTTLQIGEASHPTPAGSDAALAEIATRAWAELNAGGIPARLLDCPVGQVPCAAEAPPPGRNAIVLRTFRLGDETITEAALTPAGHDRPTVRRSLTVDDRAEAEPKVMAIRAVELVNAMLLQVDAAAADSAASGRRGVDPEYPGQHLMIEKPVVEHPAIWQVGAGGSFLKGPGGLSAAAGFAIRGSRTSDGRWGISAILTEAPSLTKTATLDGSLGLNQQLADVELTYRVVQRRRVRGQVGLGGGVYHVDASWTDTPAAFGGPFGTQAFWALLLSGGAGAELELGRKFSLFGEARAVLASPHPLVWSATSPSRPFRTGAPSLLLALGLQRAF